MSRTAEQIQSTALGLCCIAFACNAALAKSESKEQPTTTQPASTNILGLPAAPLTEPLVTDRPDFTESAVTVPWGHLQLETGYTFTYRSGDGVRSKDHTLPEMLMRVGLVENVELRVGWEGWSFTQELYREKNDAGRTVHRDDHVDGGTDMTVGFKFHLLDQKGLIPDFGVIVDTSLPTGEIGKTSGDVDPKIGLLWGYDLNDDWALSGNINFEVPTSDCERFFQTSASISLGYSITEKIGSYVEYYGFYPNDLGTDCAHYINGGLTYLLTDNVQLDVRLGHGLNHEADDLFAGVGLSVRF